jgi:hypothetical protein
MTSFLTFAVQSLNLNNSLPVQSLYFPLISVYFMVSIFVTFYSLVWFWTVNNFTTKSFLPEPLEKFARLIRKCLFCQCSKEKKANKIDKVKQENSTPVIITDLNEKMPIEIKPVSASMSKETKCIKCDLCSKCDDKAKEDKDKEEKKKKKKENIESLVSALNYLMFICVAIVLAILHLIIWIRCAFEK